MNISQTVTDRTNIAIAYTESHIYMGFRLAYLHLTLAHHKGQGHAHFNCEYVIFGTHLHVDKERYAIKISEIVHDRYEPDSKPKLH